MIFLHNIRTVAKYEAKTLRRSWFFRLFSLGALFIFTLLNIGLFSPVADGNWELVSISSAVPLVNLYLLNIGQSIVVIFLAADFLKRDKKLDTNEVLYTRPMSNLEYVTGKSWGILRLFLGLDIVILSIGMLMNIISPIMSIDYLAYAAYLMLVSVPTIVFSLGLAFLLMSVLRNQAITFLILLGVAALDMFYLWFRVGSVFDYMAFGLPLFKSGIAGFDNSAFIFRQRLLYFFLGMAFVMTTALIFNRLPQSKFHRILTVALLSVFLAGAVSCGLYIYTDYTGRVQIRKNVTDASRQFENRKFVSVTEAEIEFNHMGDMMKASAGLKVLNDNDEPVGSYLFSLNPSLKVVRITSAGKELKFIRTCQIIEADPGRALGPGETDSLMIEYSGSVDEAFCYPDYNDNLKKTPYRIAMLNVHKRQAFLTPEYVLLTPEAHWYPVAALNYYPSNPARIKVDFTKYILHIKGGDGLTPVSQGRMTREGQDVTFKPVKPLTGLTLAIGNYLTDTLRVDSVEYLTYFFPGHDYYKKDLSEISDTLPSLISGIMRELETSFSTRYPFETLSLVEVPVQFYSYPRNNTQTRAEVQPSMVLLPEKLSTLENAGFRKRFNQQKKRMARNNQVITDKELQVRLFNEFVRNAFISGEHFSYINGVPLNEPLRYRLGPSFYFFRNNFFSSAYPVINALFESHLQHLASQGKMSDFMNGFGALTDIDKANLILGNISFSELLAKNPSADTLRIVLEAKGDWFFNYLRSKAGTGKFDQWFSGYIESNKFKRVDIRKFNDDIKEKFGFEFYPALDGWFNGKELAGFLFSGATASEIVVGDRTRYQVVFYVSNQEPVTGVFNISFQTTGDAANQSSQIIISGKGAGRGSNSSISVQGRGMNASDVDRIVLMGPHETKKIGMVLDAEPRAMMINTLVSKNIPGELTIPFTETGKAGRIMKEFTGEEIQHDFPEFSDPSDIIVDNEDPGFGAGRLATVSPLRKLLGIHNNSAKTYTRISLWNTPEYWQPAVHTAYYGKYIRSAVYTMAGTGDKIITWSAILPKPGYYDIYTYVGKTIRRMSIKSGSGGDPQNASGDEDNGDDNYRDMHYRIYNDDGVDDITLNYNEADGGWSYLGRYYISSDTARVALTNKSSGRLVIGDAIKWVKQD